MRSMRDAISAFRLVVRRGAMRVALQEVMRGRELNYGSRVDRGWKLFFLLPRVLFVPSLVCRSSHSAKNSDLAARVGRRAINVRAENEHPAH